MNILSKNISIEKRINVNKSNRMNELWMRIVSNALNQQILHEKA